MESIPMKRGNGAAMWRHGIVLAKKDLLHSLNGNFYINRSSNCKNTKRYADKGVLKGATYTLMD